MNSAKNWLSSLENIKRHHSNFRSIHSKKIDRPTFGKSGHRAAQRSAQLLACFIEQSAVSSLSREGGGVGGRPLSPSSVRLSAAEVEAARIAGISPAEYARQKAVLVERQRRGETQ
jgi:hypothetical protein